MPRTASRKAQTPRPSWWKGSLWPLKRARAPEMSFSKSLLKPFVAFLRKSTSRMGSMTSASSHDNSGMNCFQMRSIILTVCVLLELAFLFSLTHGFSGSRAYSFSCCMFFVFYYCYLCSDISPAPALSALHPDFCRHYPAQTVPFRPIPTPHRPSS